MNNKKVYKVLTDPFFRGQCDITTANHIENNIFSISSGDFSVKYW